MKECPLIKEFSVNPMVAIEFVENHKRLALWVKLVIRIMSWMGGVK